MNYDTFCGMFDHTNLKADATHADFQKLCDESRQYGFAMVAINSYPVALCKEMLTSCPVHVGAAIGFPLGQMTIEAKAFEAENAILNGADEIDFVINVGKMKEQDTTYIEKEMETIVSLCKKHNVISKVIFENCYLTEQEIRTLCEIALRVRPVFIKTSTGFGTYGARVEDIQLMKSIVGDKVKVKAAGGIRDLDTALSMVQAGAERLGSSNSVAIVKEFQNRLQ